MVHKIYFNASGSNPLEVANINQAFYQQFVEEHGSSLAHADLWTGYQLENLITSLVALKMSNIDRSVIDKCNANISFYKKLYKELTTKNIFNY